MNLSHNPIVELTDFLRFPSISTQPEYAPDLIACAEWLVERLNRAGLSAKLYPTAGHPIVLAQTEHDPEKRTVLIYGHYDVQPVDPLNQWTTPPFEPRIDESEGKIYARGSADNKGQILPHILGVAETLEKKGALPVNVIFLIEGEEEIGSPHLENFLKEHREELNCDVIVISDTGMAPGNLPAMTYGLRGLAAMELIVRGPARDLHSGLFGGAVANPLIAAAKLIASLHDEKGHILIPHFYDDVESMQPWEKEASLAFEKVSGGDTLVKELAGVRELFGEIGFSTQERLGARPAVDINGFGGGYQGEGTKTVLPKEAFIKLTFRLVPNQNPEAILDHAAAHFQKHLLPGVTLEIKRGHAGEAYVSNPQSPDGKAAQAALQQAFGATPVLLRDGASIPILTSFKKILGVDSLLLGLANPDCCIHSPNENMLLKNFLKGIRLNQILLEKLAES
ncbi:MAG: dipeptidase [Chthoniobacterales bacterium]